MRPFGFVAAFIKISAVRSGQSLKVYPEGFAENFAGDEKTDPPAVFVYIPADLRSDGGKLLQKTAVFSVLSNLSEESRVRIHFGVQIADALFR